MERTLLLAAGFWVSGVGAWAVGAGYALAPYVRPRLGGGLRCQEDPALPPLTSGDRDGVVVDVTPPESLESLQLLRPNDASALLTESQRARLRPVNPLKRKRRSRKVRVASGGDEEKFVPLVSGARTNVAESIMASYSGETLDAKREARSLQPP